MSAGCFQKKNYRLLKHWVYFASSSHCLFFCLNYDSIVLTKATAEISGHTRITKNMTNRGNKHEQSADHIDCKQANSLFGSETKKLISEMFTTKSYNNNFTPSLCFLFQKSLANLSVFCTPYNYLSVAPLDIFLVTSPDLSNYFGEYNVVIIDETDGWSNENKTQIIINRGLRLKSILFTQSLAA